MKRRSLFLCTLSLATFLAACAPLTPDLPSGDEQQLNRPGTLSGPPPRNPLEDPDEATQSYVPGQ